MPLTTRYGFTNSPTPGNPVTAWTSVTVQANAGTSTVTVNSAASFPSSVEFDIIVGDLQVDSTLINVERAHVLSVAGNMFTIQGTWALTHLVNEEVYHELTALGLQNNPGAMTDSGDFQYLDSTGRMARLAAPASGTYAMTWAAGVPTWAVPGSTTQILYNNAGSIAGNAFALINPAGHIGLGSNAAIDSGAMNAWAAVSAVIGIQNNRTTLPSGITTNIFNSNDLTPAADIVGPHRHTGQYNDVQFLGTHNAANTEFYGILSDLTMNGAGTVLWAFGQQAAVYIFDNQGTISQVYGANHYIYTQSLTGNITDAFGGSFYPIQHYGGGTVTNSYGVYVWPVAGTGTITNNIAVWASAQGRTGTCSYGFWSDEQGVFAIKADNTFDAVYQASPRLYNPLFTKYTPCATNHERVVLQWETNVAVLRTESGGTGTLRDLKLAATNLQLGSNTVLAAGKTLKFTGSGSGVITVTTQAAAGTWTLTLPTDDGTPNQVLQTDGAGVTSWAAGLTIGSTAIASGVSGRVLYDNAGVLGEMTTTGSGTVVVLATSPTITTSLLFANAQGFFDDGADTIGQRRTTNAQTYNLYSTFTDASNYERLALSFSSSVPFIQPQKAGSGTARAFNLNSSDSGNWIFIPADGAQSFGMQLAAVATNTVKSVGKVNVGSGTSINITTGTHIVMRVLEGAAPTSTSTLVFIPFQVSPTINYSAGTPGAGSYEAVKVAVTETALPTGTNYLFRGSAGAAGTTDKFTVTNGGLTSAAGSVVAQGATAIPAGGTAGAGLMVSSTANFGVFFGSGTPSLSAAKGSLYLRSDGTGTTDRAYINTNGSTTWTAITTVA